MNVTKQNKNSDFLPFFFSLFSSGNDTSADPHPTWDRYRNTIQRERSKPKKIKNNIIQRVIHNRATIKTIFFKVSPGDHPFNLWL